MQNFPTPPNDTRIGLHFFPDTLHYRQQDMHAWVPQLKAIGASWLTLTAPIDRAIPEHFIRGLIDAGIEPVLHLQATLNQPPTPADLNALLESYARWGVHYLALFDQPNCHDHWPVTSWTQFDLVERFLDIYIPLAEAIAQAGLFPVFPPLKPGGDYWDTAFLRASLGTIKRRGHHQLLEKLVLGAYAWAHNLPLDWGAGGPERWPGARPYLTPSGEQDQCGFHIFDWYNAISQAVLMEPLPIIILAGGSRPGDQIDDQFPPIDPQSHAQRNLQLAQRLTTQASSAPQPDSQESIPPNVLACNFWLLAADPASPHAAHAWYQADGTTLPVVEALRQWAAETSLSTEAKTAVRTNRKDLTDPPRRQAARPNRRMIAHYLLLPTYEWGIADWHLDVIRNYVKRHQPTIGFSPAEAKHAARVTVVGGPQSFPNSTIEALRTAGCDVVQISGDGTSIATQLDDM